METAAAPWWRLMREICPEARIVTVRRPVAEVVDSLARLGLTFDCEMMTARMRYLDRKLDQIESRCPDVLSVRFAELADEAVCARVFEHCLPFQHDHAWWAALAPLSLQISIPMLARYFDAFRPQMERLAATAKHQIITGMNRRSAEIEGVTFQTEPFDTFYRDAQQLFAEHLVEVGEPPDAYQRKNLPLFSVLDRMGALHIATARCNGRMFGYLMSVLSPSLESPDLLTAIQTPFFVAREFPGLGMKLQRWAVTSLRERGVGEIYMRAGTRGSGPRLGSLYRRLGAFSTGELYMIDMKEVA